ncbi:hypothetical protein DL93DRAFT_2160286 [Clavulina sp. PMI_390]|nr:hypothetical protein DL93DRAFT_2160286 [Clavulina sp. PMI_390]
MAQMLSEFILSYKIAEHLHQYTLSRCRSICKVASEPLPHHLIPLASNADCQQVVDGMAFLLHAVSPEPLSLALRTQPGINCARKLQLVIATSAQRQSETHCCRDLAVLQDVHASLREIHLSQHRGPPPSPDRHSSRIFYPPSFIRLRTKVMTYVWPYLREEYIVRGRASLFLLVYQAIRNPQRKFRRFQTLLEPKLSQNVESLVAVLGLENPDPDQCELAYDILDYLRDWAEEASSYSKLQEVWLEQAADVLETSPMPFPFFDDSIIERSPINWLVETSSVCVHIRNVAKLAESSRFAPWKDLDIEVEYVPQAASLIARPITFTFSDVQSLFERAGCGDRSNDDVLIYLTARLLSRMGITKPGERVPDIQTRRFQYLPPANVHNVCRVMFAVASPGPRGANCDDWPWTLLPFIGSSSPPCGFCGLFVRAVNIATDMRIQIPPIHRSNMFPPWSFPEFSSLAHHLIPARNVTQFEVQVMELMCHDLRRVIKEEWRFVCFPFDVPWPQLMMETEAYSDSDDGFSSSDNDSSDTGVDTSNSDGGIESKN